MASWEHRYERSPGKVGPLDVGGRVAEIEKTQSSDKNQGTHVTGRPVGRGKFILHGGACRRGCAAKLGLARPGLAWSQKLQGTGWLMSWLDPKLVAFISIQR